ncbi:hypothetical protein OG462_29370 [Streptomyces sp. NBC_01077]|uniref:hypothetical protein n=1 Tax=Streptomyces sp. NBC_01077 TaxID=2903746 RepID=UPI0038645B03|nr:hypothetical protein OG462_29370 [Streptomyces sp. NBC_01077]
MSTWLAAVVIPLVVSLVTSLLAWKSHDDRLRAELRTEFTAEAVITHLLRDSRWDTRKFTTIQGYLKGFGENELRKLLVRSGALCFDEAGDEVWGLRERNRDKWNPNDAARK